MFLEVNPFTPMNLAVENNQIGLSDGYFIRRSYI